MARTEERAVPAEESRRKKWQPRASGGFMSLGFRLPLWDLLGFLYLQGDFQGSFKGSFKGLGFSVLGFGFRALIPLRVYGSG